MNDTDEIIITVRNLKVGYGENVILQNINFQVRHGEVFVILGGSGSGKSTLLKNLIGLYTPLEGEVWIEGGNLIAAADDERRHLLRKFGVTYQSGALFGSMSVLENVRLPLDELIGPARTVERTGGAGQVETGRTGCGGPEIALRIERRHAEAGCHRAGDGAGSANTFPG